VGGAARYDFAIAESDGSVEVELMLVALQSTPDGALIVAILIILLLAWGLSR
jgi:TRAP-type mannitol/chloroaromatic compound transport system permease large subunit